MSGTTEVGREVLTLGDLDLLTAAAFMRPDEAESRDEDRWHEIQVKLQHMRTAAEAVACRCGHPQRIHRHAIVGDASCVECGCPHFDAGRRG